MLEQEAPNASGGLVSGTDAERVPVMLQQACSLPLAGPFREMLEKLGAQHREAEEKHRAEIEAMPGPYIVGMDISSDKYPDHACAVICKKAPDGRIMFHSISIVPNGTEADLHVSVRKSLKGMPYDVRLDKPKHSR